jgi:hypothetical protein
MFAYFVTIPLLVFGAILIEEYKNYAATGPAPAPAPVGEGL